MRRRRGGLTRAAVARSLEAIAKEDGVRLELGADDDVRCGIRLAPTDADAPSIPLEFAKGTKISTSVRAVAAPLAYWLLGRVAARLDAVLDDPQVAEAPLADSLREEAFALLRAHEDAILDGRRDLPYEGPADGSHADDLLEWLRRRGILDAPAGDAALIELVARLDHDPRALYEALLDHPAVEEVFANENEFVDAVGRFIAEG